MFAYGQTGTGKTYTINGDHNNPGLIPRSIQTLFDKRNKGSLNTTFKLSYLEIYNEKLYDLLQPSKQLVEIREVDGQIICMPLKTVEINTLEEFHSFHSLAISYRRTASTNLNSVSSRSHFIMQLTLQTTTNDHKIVSSKLQMIDLAGSEDNKRTGNAGQRLVESASINTSLFVLGKVVESLNSNSARIPYRDSKITRLLQDSLGGTALAFLFCTLSPDNTDLADTYNTLNFAMKSTQIKNKVQVNEIKVANKPVAVDLQNRLAEWKSLKNKTNSAKITPLTDITKRMTSLTGSTGSVKSCCELFSPTTEFSSNPPSTNLEVKALQNRVDSLEAQLKVSLSLISEKENCGTETHLIDEQRIRNSSKRILDILNNGDKKSIMTLKLIGKKRSDDIITARENFGHFNHLDDLVRAGLKPTQIDAIFKINCD